MLAGLSATIAVSVTAIIGSVVLGVLLAVAGLAGNRVLRSVNRVYVEVFRAIPLLVLLLWVYYGLPVLFGLQFDVFSAGVLALALSDAATLAVTDGDDDAVGDALDDPVAVTLAVVDAVPLALAVARGDGEPDDELVAAALAVADALGDADEP
jgi:His/Glu/Gln/Arg/opine family amino acid ABC transporter permease subunit